MKINLQESLFGDYGITSKTAKRQFVALMAWCKTWKLSKPFGSRIDDDDQPTELLNTIEEKFSCYEEALKSAEAEMLTKQKH